jgi:hypothetical protein
MTAKRKRRDPEYALHVFHHEAERSGKTAVAFLVRTVKDFTSFNYEILLDAKIQERTVRLKILGLRTTPMIMPGIGPARGMREFENLQGKYELVVVKPDGETNEFQLSIASSQITLGGSPVRPFILVSSEPAVLSRI